MKKLASFRFLVFWSSAFLLRTVFFDCTPPAEPTISCGSATCLAGQVCFQTKCSYVCPQGQTTCNDGCFDLQTTPSHCGACSAACSQGQACQSGKCVLLCRSGEVECQGRCITLSSDPAHCGVCGKACLSGQRCEKGVCGSSCPAGWEECQGACIDKASDRANCGGCGKACQSGEFCVQGVCQTTCPPSWKICKQACVDPASNPAHCGLCDTACKSNEACDAGTCIPRCSAGTSLCAGVCVDLQTSSQHCGLCGAACKSDETCSGGACLPSCGGGMSRCKGACVDLQTSASHCGLCERACSPGSSCALGVCVAPCPTGSVLCRRSCVDLQTDFEHCGSCGGACKVGEACVNSTCIASCGAGKIVCSGVCLDPASHPEHCGGCGKACPAGAGCAKSLCTSVCKVGETTCSGACADLQTSSAHCGLCGKACAADEGCCKGVCLDLRRDPQNCGKCGTSCPVGQACLRGVCAVDSWAVKAGGTGNDTIRDIFVDASRNVYALGSFRGTGIFGTTPLTATGSQDGFLAKLLPSGTWDWIRRFGGTGAVETRTLAVTPTGESIVAGYFSGSILFGTTVLNSSPNVQELFLAKMDAQGTWLWAKQTLSTTSSSNLFVPPRAMRIDAAGNIFLTFYYNTAISLGPSLSFPNPMNSSESSLMIAKLDSQGTWLWAKPIKISIDPEVCLRVDTQGALYIAANHKGSLTLGTTTLQAASTKTLFLAKMDSQGAWVWAQSAGGSGSHHPGGLALAPDGSIYVGGRFSQRLIVGSTNIVSRDGDGDLFVAKSDAQGRWLWLTTAGGLARDFVAGLAVQPQGLISVVGTVRQANFSFNQPVPAYFDTFAVAPPLGADALFHAHLSPEGRWLSVTSIFLSSGLPFPFLRSFFFDAENRIYLGGAIDRNVSFGSTSLIHTGGGDAFLSKGYP